MSDESALSGASANPTHIKFDGSIVPTHTDEWEQLARHVDGAFCVIVETAHGKYRRRVWLTLAPAERAAEKARDAGHDAVVMLAELKPLHRVEGAAPNLGRIVAVGGGSR